VRDVRVEDERVVVIRMDGGTDLHSRALNGWRIERRSDHSTALIELGGVADRPAGVERAAPSREHGLVGALARAIGSLIGVSDATHHPSGLRVPIAPRLSGGDPIPGALEIPLGEPHYRRSEQSWREAGSPSAVVRLGADDRALIVDVCVRKSGSGLFAPPRERNELDNEHPDTNSDGLQLYVAAPGDASAAGWLLVPEIPPPRVRTSPIAGMGADRPIASRWEPTGDGYRIVCEIPLTDGERRDGLDFDLIVNEIAPGRERRRGQLVLSGGEGEWIYLRGDRQPRDRYLRLVLGHAV
jgi:hypothetical protein